MKNQKFKLIGFVLFLTMSLVQCKSTTQEDKLKNDLDTYFKKEVFSNSDNVGNPGLSIIITEKDSILYVGNFGYSNLENKTKITENTVFDIASTCKQFTGMAIAILEDQGKINVNDKIVKYLSDLPECMHEITIYQLVHHTSGIRDWPALFGLTGWQPEDKLSLKDIFQIIKKQESLNFAPGTGFLYSNSNYNLLAKIIENVTNTEINSWMRENIFSPLKMNNTYFTGNNGHNKMEVADSYIFAGQGYFPFSNNLSAPGSSSLNSTTSDMSKWMINFYNMGLEGENAHNIITEKGILENGESINYAYGLNITKLKNMEAYVHDGAWGGFRSITVYFPDKKVGIVILSNNGTVNPQGLINDIVDIIFKLEKEKETKASDTEEIEINDEFFALCAGKYEQVDDKGCYLTFFKEGNKYFVNVYDNDYQLYAKSDSVYFVKEAEAEFVFHLKDGKVNSHTLNQNGNSYLAIKEGTKTNELEIDHNALVGSYYSGELEVSYEVLFENDILKIQSNALPFIIVLQHSQNLVFTSNTGLIQTITFKEVSGQIQEFVLDNPRARNISFKKV